MTEKIFITVVVVLAAIMLFRCLRKIGKGGCSCGNGGCCCHDKGQECQCEKEKQHHEHHHSCCCQEHKH